MHIAERAFRSPLLADWTKAFQRQMLENDRESFSRSDTEEGCPLPDMEERNQDDGDMYIAHEIAIL